MISINKRCVESVALIVEYHFCMKNQRPVDILSFLSRFRYGIVCGTIISRYRKTRQVQVLCLCDIAK